MTHIRIFALLMAALMFCTLFAGCSGSSGTGATTPAANSGGVVIPPSLDGKVYAASFVELDKTYEYTGLNAGVTILDGRIIMPAWKVYNAGTDEEMHETVLISVSPDGSDIQTLPIELPQEGQIMGLAVSPEGDFWLQHSIWHYDEKTNTSSSEHYLRRYAPDGTEKLTVDLAQYIDEEDYFSGGTFCCDAQGNIAMGISDAAYIFSPEGKLLFILNEGGGSEWIRDLSLDKERNLLVHMMGNGGWELRTVDMEKKDYGETLKLPERFNYNHAAEGRGAYDFYLSDDYLYGWDGEKEEVVPILNWLELDVNSENIQNILAVGEEEFLVMAYNDTWDLELIRVYRTDPAGTERTVLRLATAQGVSQFLKSAVIDFNKSNPTYRVEITDYMAATQDYAAAVTNINNDIIAGNVPDILSMGDRSKGTWIAKGIIADLYPFIDADEELSREAFVSCVLSACEYADGKLYEIPAGFELFTLIGRESLIGDVTGWTMDEMNAAFAAHPGKTTITGLNREMALMYFSMIIRDRFVNDAEGTCSFDNPEFCKLLAFIKTFPEEVEYTSSGVRQVMESTALTYSVYLHDVDSYQFYDEALEGDLTMPGFPGEAGSQGALVMPNESYAIAAGSPNQAGAWEFIRHMLKMAAGEQVHYIYSIPSLQEGLDAQIKEAQTVSYDADGNECIRVSWGMDDVSVDMYAISDEQLAGFMEVIENAKRAVSYDEKLFNIIAEDASAFFEGAKSAEETAKIIQSRVQIYLSEQR